MENILQNFSIKISKDGSDEILSEIHIKNTKDKTPFYAVNGIKIFNDLNNEINFII